MAEVFNKAGGGISLSRVRAAEVEGAVGTVRRERVDGLDLSAVASGVNNYLEATRASKAAKNKEAANRVASEEAIGEAKIVESFNFGGEDDIQSAVQLATGYTDDMGAPPSPEAYKALADLQKFTARVNTARQQGNSQAALDMALIRYRTNFLAKHPEFGPEAISATSGITGAKPSGIEANARDEADVRAREQTQDTAIRGFLVANGVTVDPTASPEAVKQYYDVNFAPKVQRYSQAEQALKQLQTDQNIDDTQREIGVKTVLQITQPGNVQGAMAAFNAQLSSNASPEQRVQAVDEYLAQFQIKIMEQEGYADPAKMQAAYGQVFQVAQTVKDTIMKKGATTALETTVKMQDAVADLFINEKFGIAPRVMSRVIMPMSNVVGPAVMTELFEKGSDPGQPQKIGYQIFKTFASIATDPNAVSLDPFAPVTDRTSMISNPGARSAQARDGEVAVAQLSRPLIDQFDTLTPEAQVAAGDYWARIVKSPYAAKSGTAWADVMDAMDSPKFGDFLDATGNRDELSPVVVGNSRRYTTSLLQEMDTLTKGQPDPKFTYNESTKTLAVDPASLAGLDPDSRDRYIRASRRVSQALRVLHEKFGQGGSVPELAGELGTMGE
jgi:hypothetical protein